MQNSLYKLFEHKCVLEVCVHIHPIMIKIHPVFFFNPYFKIHFLKSGCSEVPVRMTYFFTGHSHDSSLTRPFYLRPVLSELSSVHHCVDSGAGEDKMSPIKRLRFFVVGCNNEYSSRHLLLTSEELDIPWHPLKTQRINVTFILKGMHRSRSAYMRLCSRESFVILLHLEKKWAILTKVCYRLFIKTLKNYINLWKMAIRWPL